jgi:hypothetical protein
MSERMVTNWCQNCQEMRLVIESQDLRLGDFKAEIERLNQFITSIVNRLNGVRYADEVGGVVRWINEKREGR